MDLGEFLVGVAESTDDATSRASNPIPNPLICCSLGATTLPVHERQSVMVRESECVDSEQMKRHVTSN